MNGAPAKPISGTVSSLRSRRIASSDERARRLGLERRAQARHVGRRPDRLVDDRPHALLDPDVDARAPRPAP